jgi:hypothetical protein
MPRNDEPQVLAHLQFNSACDLQGRLEECFGLLTPLANLHSVVSKPTALFFYATLLQREIKEFARA